LVEGIKTAIKMGYRHFDCADGKWNSSSPLLPSASPFFLLTGSILQPIATK
jgi:hypothetical protein